MSFRPVFHTIGLLLLILAAAMLPPFLIDAAATGLTGNGFGVPLLLTALAGYTLYLMNRGGHSELRLRETFLVTAFGWVAAAAFAALPVMTSAATDMSYSHAFFEAMSGLTGTGSTVLSNLDTQTRGLLFWRAELHFMGGLAFIVVAYMVLPMLQVSGMQIFKNDTPDIDRVVPANFRFTFYIALIYCGLTFLCAVLLKLAGMGWFDALCHGMATLATGGFSTHDASIAVYGDNRAIQMILIVFMLLAALPFILYLRALRGDTQPLLGDDQVRAFLGTLVTLVWMMTIYLIFTGRNSGGAPFIDALFMITSAMTTTGFVTEDYALWGHMIVGIAFLTAFFGGCSGSTAGGSKIFRIHILFRMLTLQLNKMIRPHGVFQMHYNNKNVDSGVQAAVAGFFFLYIMIWLGLSILLEITGHDFATAFSGALAALSNTGTGTSNGIGSGLEFADMSETSIWVYTAAMLLGRLEFLTFIAILMPAFWRK